MLFMFIISFTNTFYISLDVLAEIVEDIVIMITLLNNQNYNQSPAGAFTSFSRVVVCAGGLFYEDKIMLDLNWIYAERIEQKESELIKKARLEIITWDEAVVLMDKYLKSLGL